MDTLTFEQQNQRDLQLLSELSVHQANVIRQLYADSAELDNLKRRMVAVQQGIQQRNQIAQAPDSRALEITRAFTNGEEPPFPHGFRGPHGLRECLPQMYQDHELEMGDGSDIPATQVYFDGQSSQGLLPHLYQSSGLEMSDGSAHHEQQAHIDGHLGQDLAPQMSPGFDLGNGSAFHEQQVASAGQSSQGVLPQTYQVSDLMMSDGSSFREHQAHIDDRPGQGFAPQISAGFNFGNGSALHEQQVVFPSQFSQAVPLQMYLSFGSFDIQSSQGLLPQTYPSSGLEMSDDSSFPEQQAAFDGQSGP